MTTRQIALSTGVTLDVTIAGDRANPAILFLHGFPDSRRSWRHQIAALADHYYVIAPDQRGYARSDKPPLVSDYAVPKLIGDVFALADALEIDQFALAGHDWGGALAWAAALKNPQRVTRLMICNAAHPYVYQHSLIHDAGQRAAAQYVRDFREPDFDKAIRAQGLDQFFDERFARLWVGAAPSAAERAAYLDEWSQPGALTAMLNWYRASPIEVPPADAPAQDSDFLKRAFPVLETPTLVIWGMSDPALHACQLDGLDALVRDLTIVRLPGIGHFTPCEAPDAVNSAMRDWLAR